MKRSNQIQNILDLANQIKERKEPLGIGLKRQCWAGLAIENANSNGSKTTDYLGISFSKMKEMIIRNNNEPEVSRNKIMYASTLQLLEN